jgi:hypothetical protein
MGGYSEMRLGQSESVRFEFESRIDVTGLQKHNCLMTAKLNLKYPAILNLFPEHLDPKRTESASFLIWYLVNYYRLDTIDAIDSVCDQNGDKGVDGIFVNEAEACIYVFQSRISQKAKSSIGDTSLKEFQGTLAQFKDEVSIQNLIKSGGKADVVNLVRRLDLITKRKTHALKGVFLSNVEIDNNGQAILDCAAELIFVGEKNLEATYISDERNKAIISVVALRGVAYPLRHVALLLRGVACLLRHISLFLCDVALLLCYFALLLRKNAYRLCSVAWPLSAISWLLRREAYGFDQ